jgi:cytochrome c biogenesis protein CcmG, thiol:disulfide interchange protein DsbE
MTNDAKRINKKLLIPIAFLALAAVLFYGLFRDPREVPSPLIGKAAPAFTLPLLQDANASFTPEQMKGKVWLLNVWASWCPPCKEEHPHLVALQRQGVVAIVGLNYKDKRDAARDVLKNTGDPYAFVAFDEAGKTALDWGVYGAPETFLIDAQGIVRAKFVGPLTPQIIAEKFAPHWTK